MGLDMSSWTGRRTRSSKIGSLQRCLYAQMPLETVIYVRFPLDCLFTQLFISKGNIWAVQASATSTFARRKLSKVRRILQPVIKYVVGDVKATYLWFDNWHPHGILLEAYPRRVVYNSALSLSFSLNAEVAAVISESVWTWPSVRWEELVAVQVALRGALWPNTSVADKVVCTASSNGLLYYLLLGAFFLRCLLIHRLVAAVVDRCQDVKCVVAACSVELYKKVAGLVAGFAPCFSALVRNAWLTHKRKVLMLGGEYDEIRMQFSGSTSVIRDDPLVLLPDIFMSSTWYSSKNGSLFLFSFACSDHKIKFPSWDPDPPISIWLIFKNGWLKSFTVLHILSALVFEFKRGLQQGRLSFCLLQELNSAPGHSVVLFPFDAQELILIRQMSYSQSKGIEGFFPFFC